MLRYSLHRLLAIVYYPCYYACFNYGNEKNVVHELPQLRYVRMRIYISVCVRACVRVYFMCV